MPRTMCNTRIDENSLGSAATERTALYCALTLHIYIIEAHYCLALSSDILRTLEVNSHKRAPLEACSHGKFM